MGVLVLAYVSCIFSLFLRISLSCVVFLLPEVVWVVPLKPLVTYFRRPTTSTAVT